MSIATSKEVAIVRGKYKQGPQYGAYLADASKPIKAGQVIQAVSYQQVKDWYTGENFFPQVTCRPVQASDVAANGLKVFKDVSGDQESLAGTGRLEALKILGVALEDVPKDYGDRMTDTIDMTRYTMDDAYGGMDIRKVTYVTRGQIFVQYEGADFPNIGEAVQPSAQEDGKVTACTDRANTIIIGLCRGYFIDDNNDKWVIVELTPDRW